MKIHSIRLIFFYFIVINFVRGQEGNDTTQVFSMKDTTIANQRFSEMQEFIKQRNWKGAEEKGMEAKMIYEQLLGEECKEVADVWYGVGLIYYYQGQYDASITAWRKKLNIYSELFGKNNLDVAYVYNNIATSYNFKGEYDKAIEDLQISLGIFLNIRGPEHPDVAVCYNTLGFSYEHKGEYDNAIDYFQKALEIRLNAFGVEHSEVGRLYHNLGDTYKFKGDYKKSIEYLQKSFGILLRTLGAEHPDLANSYNSLGNSYDVKGEYNLAIEYYQKALSIILKSLGSKHPYVAFSYHNLGIAYSKKNECDVSIKYNQKALDIHLKNLDAEHPAAGHYIQSIGNCYESKGEYDKAIEYYQRALDIFLKSLGPENPDVATAYYYLGYSLNSKGEYDKAVIHYQKALEIYLKTLGEKHPSVADLYNNHGSTYKDQNKNEKAIEYYLKAIEACGYTDDDFRKINSTEQLVTSLNLLNQSYRNKYIQTQEVESLFQSYRYALTALAAVEYQQNSYTQESTKTIWQSKNYSIYEQVINTTMLKAQVDKDEDLAHTTFSYAEKSKASQLQAQIKGNDALVFTNIPDHLTNQEYNLRIDITWREKQRHAFLEEGKSETDTTVLAISSKLFDLNQEYIELKNLLEKDYPDYFRLKYDLTTISLEDVQNNLLSNDQTLLEYFIGDSSVFIFTIQKNSFDIVEVKKDFPLEDWIKQLQHGLYGYHGQPQSSQTDQLYEETLLAYNKVAQQLYQKLITPVRKKLNTQQLIIIPDGVLGYVPFGALLSGKPKKVSNFKSYPFLEKEFQISYCYSATLLREMVTKQHRKQPSKTLAAFAPFYNGSYEKLDSTINMEFIKLEDGRDSIVFNSLVLRKDFAPLEASGEEVKVASQLWEGDYFINTSATEDLFNQIAGDYRIVHLSTHGVADSRVGDYSYLAFAEIPDGVENELLYVRDLYNIQLNADLIVLSACETAAGELQRGEGIISLARAFAYAGAKSMITTLWVADDVATKELMKSFYVHLKNADTKDKALQSAKINLMNNGNSMAHPFFWSGFIPMGDMSALK